MSTHDDPAAPAATRAPGSEAARIDGQPDGPAPRRLRAPVVLVVGLSVATAVLGGLLLASVVTIADRVLTGSFTMLPDSGVPARSRQPVPLAPLWLRISGVVLAVDLVASLVPLLLLRLNRRFAALSGLTQGLAAWLIGSALGVLLLIVVGLLS